MQRNRTRSEDSGERGSHRLASKASHFAGDVGHKAQELTQEIVHEGAAVEKAITGWVRKRPVESVLLGVAAGLFFGRFRARIVDTALLALAAGIGCTLALSQVTGAERRR